MIKLTKLTYLAIVTLMACTTQPKDVVQNSVDKIYEGVEFEMPKVKEPVFQDYSVSIEKYNAVNDGKTLNTKAFADAIADVANNGGGKVVVPRGIWLTGPIVLKSNINLHLEDGALILFSENKDLYPLVETSFEGLNTVRCQAPLSGEGLENIAITGNGVIDGSGDAWRFVKRSKLTASHWKELVASGGVVDEKGDTWYPSESYMKAASMSDMNVAQFDSMEDYQKIRDFLRPVLVSLVNCKKVLLDGPVFQNSPAWNVHPLMCDDLTVRNITVRNPWYSQNGDGIDIESCKNVLLYNSSFDVGDDAICIKSGKDKDGRDRGIPAENTIVKNCIVYHGHGGVTVGSEMSGGVKNLHASGCTFVGTDVGLRFKSTRGRGGIVENIFISDIDMIDIPTNAISFNMYYGGLSVSEMLAQKDDKKTDEVLPEVTEETPQFKDIVIKNVTCKGALQAIYLQGLPEMNLENVLLENLTMVAKNGLLCMDATGIKIKDLHLDVENYPALNFVNVKDLKVEKLDLANPDFPMISVAGSKTKQVSIELPKGVSEDKAMTIGKAVDKNEVVVATTK
ncbi:glycoside hydrolase family 28 protein [Plebeiibacterium sediminum]|uniref:Glycoside hydrolase family 28 protein n=1 Tax=Plebeiibacterium sediminum TaxID=2992112 RepID=A0AAE3SDT5_9BACT|nr:glycoside hydrolase family 28 protein [Plebeiobacterium sediminum]MCW3785595.1 glycoside hydrolase family 28 protein [Plebeiobacterium sediminum]